MGQNLWDLTISIVGSGVAWSAKWLWLFIKTNFTLLAATGIAAFFGAYGAQRIADRTQSKRRLVEEIRSANTAAMLASNLVIAFLVLKRQHVMGLKERYDQQRAAAMAHHQRGLRADGALQEEFEYDADFQYLDPLRVPIDALQDMLFEKLSVVGRAIAVLPTLSRSIHELNTMLVKRNKLISELGNPNLDDVTKAQLYFGLPTAEGQNSLYPDTMDAISQKTDDCIWFSKFLCEDLAEYGQQLAKQFGRNPPKVHTFSFEQAEQDGLVPDDAEFHEWLNLPAHPPFNL